MSIARTSRGWDLRQSPYYWWRVWSGDLPPEISGEKGAICYNWSERSPYSSVPRSLDRFPNKMTASKKRIKPKSWPIERLPGLSPEQQDRLVKCGITSTGKLLRTARTPEQKLALANKLQLNIKYVNKWVALADLARVPRVGCQYCGLLLHAGVASPTQLAEISVLRLHQQVLKLQVATMQRRDLCPGVEEVLSWIEQAKRL